MREVRAPRLAYDNTGVYIRGGAVIASIPGDGMGPCYCYWYYHPADWPAIKASILEDIARVDKQLAQKEARE